ncbi:uncharacterized protein LOC100367673 [Saccoglossus kowalevskii]
MDAYLEDEEDLMEDTPEIIEGKEKLRALVEYLDKADVESISTQAGLDTLLSVDSVLGDFSSYDNMPKMKKYGIFLADINFPRVFANLWDKIRNPIDEGLDSKEQSVIYAFALFEGCKTMIGGLCDSSVRFSCKIGQEGVIGRLVTDLENPRLQPSEISEESSVMEEDAIYGMLRSTIMCMHNSIKNWSDNKPYFREANAVKLLHKYVENCKNPSIRANSLFTLVYIVNEDENHMISAGEEMDFFITTLKKSIENTYSHHMCEVGDYTFTALEIVDGIIHLAANDTNKEKLVDKNVLPLLVKLLCDDCTDRENEKAAVAIWNLAFHENNKERIKAEPNCLDELKRLKESSNQAISKACTGALWQLGGMEQQLEHAELMAELKSNDEEESGETNLGHVMISYQWDCQKVMIKVKDLLKAAGFRVWMDVDQMAGSTLEAMAEAVEKADVVLICMSEKYKNSPSCRTEAEYTYKLRKDFIPIQVQANYSPDGWLGILVGTKLYFDASADSHLNETVSKLIRELGERGKTSKTGKVKAHEKMVAADATAITSASRGDRPSLEKWNNYDVLQWLSDTELGHVKKRFTGYNGKSLIALKKMEMRAPEFFYATLKQDMGFKNMLDLTKFSTALEDINE